MEKERNITENKNAKQRIGNGKSLNEANKSGKKNIISDKKLYELCKKFGRDALFARRKFSGLIPEVNKRLLFKKKGFSSIYHFAAKLAGMSREQVDMILRLERKFEDKPVLREALVSGEISANKLVRISSIATVENQEELFDQTKLLSNRAVEVFVRDVKHDAAGIDSANEIQNGIGLSEPLFDSKSLHVQTFHDANFGKNNLQKPKLLNLDPDVEKELSELQEKGIDINEILRKALKERRENLETEKAKIAEEINKTQREKTLKGNTENQKTVMNISTQNPNGITKALKISRYIPVKVKKILKSEYGEKCSIPDARKKR